MPVNQKTEKNKGFAFITAPENAYIVLIKLNGIEKDRKIRFKIPLPRDDGQTSLLKIRRDHKLQSIDKQRTRTSLKEEILFQVSKHTVVSIEHHKKHHKKKQQIIVKATIRKT